MPNAMSNLSQSTVAVRVKERAMNTMNNSDRMNSSNRTSNSTRLAMAMTVFAIGLALIVVLMGGWTRLSDAGLGCPDWPGCFGEWVLPSAEQGLQQAQQRFPDQLLDSRKGWTEMIHRYLAGSLGLVIAGLAVLAHRNRHLPGYPVKLCWALLALVILQALFGMWTVTLKLLPQVVTLHLLGGLTTLALLMRLRQRLVDRHRVSTSTSTSHYGKPLLMIAMLLLFLQIALGGWTSSNYAGWACSDWLDCQSQYPQPLDYATGFDLSQGVGPNYQGGILPASARAAIQVGHRLGAVVTASYIIFVGLLLFRHRTLRAPVLSTFAVLAAQLLLGVLNIVFALPPVLALAHHAGAVALLMTLLWFYQRAEQLTQEVAHA